MDPNTRLLAAVVSFINQGQAPGTVSPALPQEILQSVSSAAAKILATAARGGTFLAEAGALDHLKAYAAGHFPSNEVVRPQLIAAILLWAEIWKQGS